MCHGLLERLTEFRASADRWAPHLDAVVTGLQFSRLEEVTAGFHGNNTCLIRAVSDLVEALLGSDFFMLAFFQLRGAKLEGTLECPGVSTALSALSRALTNGQRLRGTLSSNTYSGVPRLRGTLVRPCRFHAPVRGGPSGPEVVKPGSTTFYRPTCISVLSGPLSFVHHLVPRPAFT